MKSVFSTIIFIVFMLYLAGVSIQLKPFRVKLENVSGLIGVLLVAAGICFFEYGLYRKSYKKGVEDGSKATIELFKERAKEIIQEEKNKKENENEKW